jgi:hypothetical protein
MPAPNFLAFALALTLHALPNPGLQKAFVNTSGWTGGDAAYSVKLSSHRSLWLFGDSLIGRIDKGVRTKMDMINNSAAWLDQDSIGAFKAQWFWKKSPHCAQAASLLSPKDSHAYYWPSAVLQNSGKLAIFCKVVKNIPGDKTGFGFDWFAEDLILVENATDAPTKWRTQTLPLPGGEVQILPGAAAVEYGDFSYIYGTRKQNNVHNVVLMRVPTSELYSGRQPKFQFWSERRWLPDPLEATTLFAGAPEMSVSRVDGLPGFWCVYSENGLSPRIMLRHADRPEGPWSEPTLAYTAPEPLHDASIFCYGAKHHPELAREPRTLVITYCLNLEQSSRHRTRPFVYFPRALTLQVTPREVP